jgi:phospholipase C
VCRYTGYYGDGTVADATANPFTLPPSPTPSIGNVLLAAQVSFRWYGEGWNQYVDDPNNPADVYCNICNPFQYQTSIMTNEALRTSVIQDTADFYTDLQDGILPAVSLVKPSGLNDGHPASSKYSIFEAFVRKILTELRQKPDLWKSTAVFITTDEAGGYYDSGYIQPLDFFGDSPRIMLLVVSPISTGATSTTATPTTCLSGSSSRLTGRRRRSRRAAGTTCRIRSRTPTIRTCRPTVRRSAT